MSTPHPRVGVAALIRNPSDRSEVLVGRRMGSHGSGAWQFPGGHLEYGEDILTCAARETLEETGLEIEPRSLAAVTNSVFVREAKHYITLFVVCEIVRAGQVPEVLEPEKCEGWSWVKWDTLREWIDHHEDQSPEWSDKKCFLPIVDLVRDDRNLTGFKGYSIDT
ncbi:nudix domain-containing protein [Truncatella angustata]|uniref:Nudix domain-containing protein n=1 Tax=Truncatella angustata TaxID=152316 RepID=A0A9P8RJF7_9PEZI|nr:nudix domain-containing protein [Truncatella angustata]KAH6645418.1 nudix domain-containing protein [Truncatella angustata]KAH8198194.1 hypothetical protein TruAng_007621 [Truncatella angustata]